MGSDHMRLGPRLGDPKRVPQHLPFTIRFEPDVYLGVNIGGEGVANLIPTNLYPTRGIRLAFRILPIEAGIPGFLCHLASAFVGACFADVIPIGIAV